MSWKFRKSNKNGSTILKSHFPLHVSSNTKVKFPAVKRCTASCCSLVAFRKSNTFLSSVITKLRCRCGKATVELYM